MFLELPNTSPSLIIPIKTILEVKANYTDLTLAFAFETSLSLAGKKVYTYRSEQELNEALTQVREVLGVKTFSGADNH